MGLATVQRQLISKGALKFKIADLQPLQRKRTNKSLVLPVPVLTTWGLRQGSQTPSGRLMTACSGTDQGWFQSLWVWLLFFPAPLGKLGPPHLLALGSERPQAWLSTPDTTASWSPALASLSRPSGLWDRRLWANLFLPNILLLPGHEFHPPWPQAQRSRPSLIWHSTRGNPKSDSSHLWPCLLLQMAMSPLSVNRVHFKEFLKMMTIVVS